MLIRTYGAALQGVEGIRVTVEVDAGRGLPSFQIVGQGDRVVTESRDRIRSALRHSGLEFPPGRVIVNLAPTDVRKAGSALDLPIAVAVAATRTPVPAQALARTLFVGELGLDGRLRPVRGALALVSSGPPELTEAAVPAENVPEVAVCPSLRALGAESLADVIAFLRGEGELVVGVGALSAGPDGAREPDLEDVRGQELARRALEIVAAGGHNLLLCGPPGSGKTLLARRLPGLLPDLCFEHALEATRVHGVAGTLDSRPVVARPPFRAPHHSISDAGLLGGGRPLRPGEVSLAHRGVLFLDEVAEFRRSALDALRQPLEEGVIRVVRAHAAACLPARFQWVAAMNPCPCGYRGYAAYPAAAAHRVDAENRSGAAHRGGAVHECSCDDRAISRYAARLSGPLRDRIDLQVPVPAVAWREIVDPARRGESSASVRERVAAARALQSARYRATAWHLNADLDAASVNEHCSPDAAGERLLERGVEQLGLSLRALHRVLRVARTIADLEGAPRVSAGHVAEAIGYRQL
jgi:magnesium chelatase family protein